MSEIPPAAGPEPTPPPAYGTAPAPLSPAEDRQWGMLSHLGGLLGFLPSLIIYLVFGPRSEFVKDQSREALNFQITLFIGYFVAFILGAILNLPLIFLVWVLNVVFSIIGGLAANKGERYRYPFALRLVS